MIDRTLEKIAWLKAEAEHKKGLAEAEAEWERCWRKKLGFNQELLTDFQAHQSRQRQLWSRRGFLLRQMAKIIRSHLHEQGTDLYQLRRDRNERMGPDIKIGERSFYFDDQELREGAPWPCYSFEGGTRVSEEHRQGWWGYQDRKHGQKTGELRSYLHDKERKRKRREK